MSASSHRILGDGAALALLVVAVVLLTPGTASGGLDRDGDADVVFANVNGVNRVCLGDGSGAFVCSDVTTKPANSFGVALGDVNTDGLVDAVFATGALNQLCLGDGAGGFTCSDMSTSGLDSQDVALGDLDADGDLDAVFANLQFGESCLGDGAGGFTCSFITTEGSTGVGLGDLDGDGDLDAVFSGFSDNQLCLGDGLGGFACSRLGTDRKTESVAVGDVDRDGDLDVIFASRERNRVCLGDGSGGFTCGDVDTKTVHTNDVALGDVDADGRLDAVFANGLERNRVCLGDGSGGFSCSEVSTDTDQPGGVALGDVDRDDHLDAVFANWVRNRVCLGDGSGGFTCRDMPPDINASVGVALALGRGRFVDDDTSIFEADIEWLADQRITRGCNPPANDRFCPERNVTRGEVAALLVRALGYTDDGGGNLFADDDDSIFEGDIDRLGTAGVAKGCNPPVNDRYCPDDFVTRGQMAAFLVRALGYVDDGGGDLYVDDDGSVFESDIDRLGTAGVTKGCNPPVNDMYCPRDFVTRGQLAAFFHRALG